MSVDNPTLKSMKRCVVCRGLFPLSDFNVEATSLEMASRTSAVRATALALAATTRRTARRICAQ